jgi:Fic family protein
MDAALFAQIISDPRINDWQKLNYKYPTVDLKELATLMQTSVYEKVPLPDFKGCDLVINRTLCQSNNETYRRILKARTDQGKFGLIAMEEEIAATLTIEDIDFSRDSVRKILRGFAPVDDSEARIGGLKKGLEFISDLQNGITEQAIHDLYMTAIGPYVKERDQLISGRYYRHDSVFIVSLDVDHTGLPHDKLPDHMTKLVHFIQAEDHLDHLVKAAIVHFYLAYLHPYFDGNGRMARLLQLWFLVQKGYPSTLFIPFSSYVEKSRRMYYQAFTMIEKNEALSGLIDVTPFLIYYNEHVYRKMRDCDPAVRTMDDFKQILDSGTITVKEKELWSFVLASYGDREFSTKQIERDYGHAAYATIRSFVFKFTGLGLLSVRQYRNRNKYRVRFNERD